MSTIEFPAEKKLSSEQRGGIILLIIISVFFALGYFTVQKGKVAGAEIVCRNEYDNFTDYDRCMDRFAKGVKKIDYEKK